MFNIKEKIDTLIKFILDYDENTLKVFEPVLSKLNELKDFLAEYYDNFEDITANMHSTYIKKNHDYGNSFDTSLDKHGLIAAIVRMEDKMNRINSLAKKEALVSDESIKDTLLDLANYSIMTVMWLNKSNKDDK